MPRAARRGQDGRRLPGGAEPARCPRRTRSSGARSRSWCCSSPCGSGASRRCKNMEQPREDRIRNDLEGAETARSRGRGREGAVPGADRRRPRTRPAASSRRRGSRPSRCGVTSSRGPRPRPPRSAARAAGRHRGCSSERAMAELRAEVADSCRSSSPSASSSATSTATRSCSSSTASSTRSGATRPMADRVEVYAQALLEIARGRGPPRRGRGRAVPVRAHRRGQRRAAHGARRTRALPADRRAAIVDELLEGRAHADDGRDRRRSSSAAGRGHDLPAIVNRFVELAAADASSTRSPRCARRCRSTTRSSTRLAEALSAGDGQAASR